MGHLAINGVSYVLPDGRPLLNDVSLRVGEGAKVALIGPNGTGKTTLLRLLSGDLDGHRGSVSITGGCGVMRQFIGTMGRARVVESAGAEAADKPTVRDLLVAVAPRWIRTAADDLASAELLLIEVDDEPAQMAYAQALVDWADAGGYDYEVL